MQTTQTPCDVLEQTSTSLSIRVLGGCRSDNSVTGRNLWLSCSVRGAVRAGVHFQLLHAAHCPGSTAETVPSRAKRIMAENGD